MNPNRKAFEFIQQGKDEEALGELLRSKERNPEDTVALYYLALLYSKKGNNDLARKHFMDILRIGKFNQEVGRVDVLLKLATLNLQVNLYDGAFRNFQTILRHEPTNKTALFQMAFLSLGQGIFDFALKYFDQYLAQEKKDFEALIGAAIANNQLDNGKNAEEQLLKAGKLEPHSKICNLLTGVQLLYNKKYKEAIPFLSKVLNEKSELQIYFFVSRILGFLKYKTNNTEEAIEDIEELKKFCKKNSLNDFLTHINFNLGIYYSGIHDWTLASSHFSIVEHLNSLYPNIEKILKNLDMIQNGDELAEQELIRLIKKWEELVIPPRKLYDLSGLKSRFAFNIRQLLGIREKVSESQVEAFEEREFAPERPGGKKVEDWKDLFHVGFQEFEKIVYRIARKLGLEIVERMNTYRDQDGLDLLTKEKASEESVMLIFRRWQETRLGDIELRNIVQLLKEQRVNKAFLMVTTGLTDGAKKTSETLPNFRIFTPEEIISLIKSV